MISGNKGRGWKKFGRRFSLAMVKLDPEYRPSISKSHEVAWIKDQGIFPLHAREHRDQTMISGDNGREEKGFGKRFSLTMVKLNPRYHLSIYRTLNAPRVGEDFLGQTWCWRHVGQGRHGTDTMSAQQGQSRADKDRPGADTLFAPGPTKGRQGRANAVLDPCRPQGRHGVGPGFC